MESKDIWYYKNVGHSIVNELVFMGVPRGTVYRLLSNRMKLSIDECHFSKMNALSQVKRAIYLLNKIKLKNKRFKRYKVYETNSLLTKQEEETLEELLRARRKIISKYGKNEQIIRRELDKIQWT